jgi:hypothetical protein
MKKPYPHFFFLDCAVVDCRALWTFNQGSDRFIEQSFHMESEYHLRKLKADLAKQTLSSMHQLIETHAGDFDLDKLIHSLKPELANHENSKDMGNSYERLYKQTKDRYEKCGVEFDNHWVCSVFRFYNHCNLYNLRSLKLAPIPVALDHHLATSHLLQVAW